MEEDQEIDFEQFVLNVFKDEPKDEKSIQFSLDCDFGDDPIDFQFKILTEIFTKGMKMVFGDNNGAVNLDYLIKDDFDYIDKYFRSFGYCFYYEKHNEFNNYKESDLSNDLSKKFLKINTRNNIYIFYFKNF